MYIGDTLLLIFKQQLYWQTNVLTNVEDDRDKKRDINMREFYNKLVYR